MPSSNKRRAKTRSRPAPPSQIEHVVDQPEQALAVDRMVLRCCASSPRVAVNAIEDEIGIAEDRLERRAKSWVIGRGNCDSCFVSLLDLRLFRIFFEQVDVLHGRSWAWVGESIGELDRSSSTAVLRAADG